MNQWMLRKNSSTFLFLWEAFQTASHSTMRSWQVFCPALSPTLTILFSYQINPTCIPFIHFIRYVLHEWQWSAVSFFFSSNHWLYFLTRLNNTFKSIACVKYIYVVVLLLSRFSGEQPLESPGGDLVNGVNTSYSVQKHGGNSILLHFNIICIALSC